MGGPGNPSGLGGGFAPDLSESRAEGLPDGGQEQLGAAIPPVVGDGIRGASGSEVERTDLRTRALQRLLFFSLSRGGCAACGFRYVSRDDVRAWLLARLPGEPEDLPAGGSVLRLRERHTCAEQRGRIEEVEWDWLMSNLLQPFRAVVVTEDS